MNYEMNGMIYRLAAAIARGRIEKFKKDDCYGEILGKCVRVLFKMLVSIECHLHCSML
jgi:hypothetical protein